MNGKYRPNVAALVVNAGGKLLICERGDREGAWQFPQGGVDHGETPHQALCRELEEETGYRPGQYIIELEKSGYRYDYPPGILAAVRQKRGSHYIGQQQTYYLCRLVASAPGPTLDKREFLQYRWIEPEQYRLEWLPEFKRDVYRAVMQDFFGVSLKG